MAWPLAGNKPPPGMELFTSGTCPPAGGASSNSSVPTHILLRRLCGRPPCCQFQTSRFLAPQLDPKLVSPLLQPVSLHGLPEEDVGAPQSRKRRQTAAHPRPAPPLTPDLDGPSVPSLLVSTKWTCRSSFSSVAFYFVSPRAYPSSFLRRHRVALSLALRARLLQATCPALVFSLALSAHALRCPLCPSSHRFNTKTTSPRVWGLLPRAFSSVPVCSFHACCFSGRHGRCFCQKVFSWNPSRHGMPRARNPVHYWMRSPPPRALTLGQAVGRGHQPSRASQSWARRWGMPRTSRERCDVSERSTTNSWVAFPRCHTCRAPGSSCSSARSRGAITCSAYWRLLSGTDEPFELSQLQARRAQLPLRYGGLGLRSAAASRAAAYWASWADAMPVIGERHPRVLARMLMGLADPRGASAAPSTRAAAQAEAALRLAGFHAPPWTALADGLATGEASHFGDAARGWQQAACASLDQRPLETLLSDLDGASRALLLSQAGPGGSLALTALPTREEFTLQDDTFRCVLLRRLRLPLPLEARACRCGGALDELGDHRAACPTAGVLVRRACPLERAAARICREAGARVATNVFLRDSNLGLPLTDGRRLEVVAHGLPAFGGVQVAVDVTLVSPLRRDGSSRSRADHEPGLALRTAAERKHRVTYPEFQRARRCRLTVLALEVGGRWGEETEAFLHRIAQGRALASPAAQRTAVAAAYRRRWGQMLAVAAQGAFAASLCQLPTDVGDAYASAPLEGDVLSDARWAPGA